MEKLSSYHNTHNRPVLIFLRQLEYSQGITFFTSNRGIQFNHEISRPDLFDYFSIIHTLDYFPPRFLTFESDFLLKQLMYYYL